MKKSAPAKDIEFFYFDVFLRKIGSIRDEFQDLRAVNVVWGYQKASIAEQMVQGTFNGFLLIIEARVYIKFLLAPHEKPIGGYEIKEGNEWSQ